MIQSDALDLAQRIADRLIAIGGVATVVLGGSRAQGAAHPDSDIDLGLYYHAGNPPDLEALRDLARELDPAATVTAIGEWGPWINGGAWLTVDGQRVDWLYREIERVRDVSCACRAGQTAWHYQPGHPFAFCDHIYLGELFCCRPLADPRGEMLELKALAEPYPPDLKQRLTDTIWEADFALATARKAAGRGDSTYVAGCLYRCASILLQVLFAVNERYWLNEKGALTVTMALPIRPQGLEAIHQICAAPGINATELIGTLDRMQALVEAVRALT